MVKKFFVYAMGLLAGSCASQGGFTPAERALIGRNPQAGVMRLRTVDSPADSLLLRQKAVPLSRQDVNSRWFGVLKARMTATVTDPANEGVGIAAPQVGISRMLVAVQRFDKDGEPLEFYINPRIDAYSDEQAPGTEGCLSVPGRSGSVARATAVTVTYNDPRTFAEVTERVSGFTAVIFQHEIDHLHGRLYTDLAIAPQQEQAITE